jgi:hypothetical protein
MPEKQYGLLLEMIYAIVAITGALGGCAASAVQVLRKKATKMLFVAYSVVGAYFGLTLYVLGTISGHIDPSLDSAIIYGGMLGMLSASLLGAANFSMSFIMRRLNLKVDVSIRRINGDGPEERRRDRR